MSTHGSSTTSESALLGAGRPPSSAVEKGLAERSVGLLGGTVLGISSVAPAYALTATIGLVVAVAGVKMPIIFIAGFLPMFFAAYAYREFNRVDPDCGTSFTWTTRAFGPYVGWLGGWVRGHRHHHRAGQPGRHRRAVPLSVARQCLQQSRSRRPLAEQAGQRPDLPGLPGVGDVHRLSRDHHHREGAVRPGLLPAGGAGAVRRSWRLPRPAARTTRRHPVLLGLVQPVHRADVSAPSSPAFRRRSSRSGAGTPRSPSTRNPRIPTRRPGRAALLCVVSILLTYLLVSVAP